MSEYKASALADIRLNNEQSAVLSSLVEWWNRRSSPLFQISGAAGTGKTTLIQYMIHEIGLSDNEVLFVAYVGKAALNMQLHGLNAKTIHSAICDVKRTPIYKKKKRNLYDDEEEDDRVKYRMEFVRKKKLNSKIKLIVVDEGAMVPKQLADWLMEYHIPMIILGDLNQLPPVFGTGVFLKKPDAILTEIMRQAKDSPIPYLARLVSEGQQITHECTIGDKITVLRHTHVDDSLYHKANIVLCPTNRERDVWNAYIRKEIFHRKKNFPVIGDKLICRENNWRICIHDMIYLINGLIGYVTEADISTITPTSMDIDFRPEFLETDEFRNITLDRKYLAMNAQEKKNYFSWLNKFEYGYAITCHLAQGSQYDHVCVDISQLRGSGRYMRQWLYTAVTRAIDQLTIII